MKKLIFTLTIVCFGFLAFTAFMLARNPQPRKEKSELLITDIPSMFPHKFIPEEQIKQSPNMEHYTFMSTDNLSMRNSEIWIIDRFGEGLTQIAEGDEYRYFSTPIFSPDSQKIAYTRVYPFELWVYDVQTDEKKLVYNEASLEEGEENVFNPRIGYAGRIKLEWIDNQHITFENFKPIPAEMISINIESGKYQSISEIEESKNPNDISFRHFSQRSPIWGEEQLGGCEEETIHSAGCAISAISMVVDYFEMENTPSTFNEFAIANFEQGYIDGCLVRWNIIPNFHKEMILKGAYFNEYNPERVDHELSLGNPVIIGFNYVSYTQIPHWVVVADKQGDKYTIYDPWDLTYTPRDLSYYGEKFDHMIVYTTDESF